MSAPAVKLRSRLSLNIQFLTNVIAFVRIYIKHRLPLGNLIASLKRYKMLWYLHEMEVDEFFLYRIWRNDLSKKDYSAFIGWKKHIRSLLALNPVQYRCLTENKFIFYTYCSTLNLPTPRIYALYNPALSKIEGVPVLHTIGELIDFISRENINRILIKPVEGTRGQSVLGLCFNPESKEFQSVSNEPLGLDLISDVLKGYDYRGISQSGFLIQERLLPHKNTMELSKYVPFSYRAITLLGDQKDPQIIAIYAKSAVGNRDTDNRHAGGLTLVLDDTGHCCGARSMESGCDLIDRHPTNGFMLKGWQVPFFKEVCELALKFARAFSLIRCVAWDIVIADKGIYVIEGNNPWNMDIQEVYDRGLWRNPFSEEVNRAILEGPAQSPWW